MEEKAKPVSGLTPKSLVVMLVLITVMSLTQTFLYFTTGIADFACDWRAGRSGLLYKGIGWWFLSLVILTVITGKLGLTRQESAVILAASFIVGSEIGMNIAAHNLALPFGANQPAISMYSMYLPNWYKVPPVASDAFLGGGPVMWSLIAGPFIGWLLTIIVWQLFQYSMALVARRAVIDMEKLPFPYAQPAVILVNELSRSENGKPLLFSKDPTIKRIWIGVILGIIMYLAFLPRLVIPDFPIPGMPQYHCTSPEAWSFDFRGAWVHTLPWLQFYVRIQPELGASLFFLPMDVLLTISSLYLLFIVILPPIVAPFGWQGREYGGTAWWVKIPNAGSWCAFWQDMTQYPINLLFVFFSGFLFYGLFRFIFGWKHFKESFMGLLGKKVPGEENEPLPLRYLWLMFIGLAIVSLIMLIVGFEMSIGLAFITIIYALLYWYSSTRMVGEAGQSNFFNEFNWILPYMGYKLGVMQPKTVGAASSALISQNYIGGYISSASFAGFSLAGFSIAKDTNTRPKDIFIAQIIAIVLGLILNYLFALISIHSLGWTVKFKGQPSWSKDWVQSIGEIAETPERLITGYENPPPGQPWYASTVATWLIGGFVFFILILLRNIFTWWPLNPVGFLLFGLYNITTGSGAIFVITLIKYSLLKIGGTSLYNKATNVAAGIIAGSLIGRVIMAISSYITGIPLPT